MQAFRKIRTVNRELMAVQDAVGVVLGPLSKSEVVDGVLIRDVVFSAAGTKKIDHKLDRQPLGWITVDRNGTATLYRSAWDAKTISLVASAALTVSVWIF